MTLVFHAQCQQPAPSASPSFPQLGPQTKNICQSPLYQSAKINLTLCLGMCCSPDPTSGTNVQFLIPGQNKLSLSPDAGGQGGWSGNDILSVGSSRAGL